MMNFDQKNEKRMKGSIAKLASQSHVLNGVPSQRCVVLKERGIPGAYVIAIRSLMGGSIGETFSYRPEGVEGPQGFGESVKLVLFAKGSLTPTAYFEATL